MLGDAGITHGTIPASTIVRQYTVQYGETDFDFISRLMEEEGIFYYFERSNSAHKILFGNTINDYANAPDETATVGVDLIQLERSSELVTNKYRHTDYDFRATAAVESDGYETKTTFSNKTMTGEIHEYGSPSPAEQNSTPLQSGLDLVSEVKSASTRRDIANPEWRRNLLFLVTRIQSGFRRRLRKPCLNVGHSQLW